MTAPAEFDAMTRISFVLFVQRVFAELNGGNQYKDNWHVHLIAAELENIRHGKTQFLAITQPPRSLKSIMASVALSAWLLGHNPAAKIIAVSYGQILSDDLAQMTRRVMLSAWYRQLFPRTRIAVRSPVSDFHTTAGGRRLATSIGGAATGIGADYIIIDDPTKPSEANSDVERATANAWVRQTLMSRFNDQTKASIVLVMQRLHEQDVVGDMQAYLELRVVNLPAIAQDDEHHEITTPFGVMRHHRCKGDALHPEREPLEVLDRLRAALGEYAFSAQYLQMPSPPGGGIIRLEHFQRFDRANPPEFEYNITSWDTASKARELNDYSVGTAWGVRGKLAYLLAVKRVKADFPDLLKAIKDQARLWSPKRILIEDTASGIQLIQQLQYEGIGNVEGRKVLNDKVMRMRNQTAPIEAGLVYLPSSAPWLAELEHELQMFPAGRYDDQVDSVSQALGYIYGHDPFRALMEAMQPEEVRPVPMIRLTAPPGDYIDIKGHKVQRNLDGSFEVEEAQAEIFLRCAGVVRVEQRHAER
ncbi:MAG: Phage uncharacterized protein-like protein [Sphingomonadales bacterium]|nr:Phage uncharacterized protein-like protein [Sphingomonadales bacterium]